MMQYAYYQITTPEIAAEIIGKVLDALEKNTKDSMKEFAAVDLLFELWPPTDYDFVHVDDAAELVSEGGPSFDWADLD